MQTISVIFRCDPALKQQAERIAAVRDETLSQVLRRALRDYARANTQLEMPQPPAPTQGGEMTKITIRTRGESISK